VWKRQVGYVRGTRWFETWVPLGLPPTRPTAIPDKWVRPTTRPADLSVGPTDLGGSPHDVLKTFQKIPHTT
jgi:hypothetical protein